MDYRPLSHGLDFTSVLFPNYSFMNGAAATPSASSIPKKEKRKSVSFNDHSQRVRKYHQDEIVNRIHLSPQDPTGAHTFLSFWGLPGLRKSRLELQSSQDLCSKSNSMQFRLDEMILPICQQKLLGKLSIKELGSSDPLSIPEEIDILYTLNDWKTDFSIVASPLLIQESIDLSTNKKHHYSFELGLGAKDALLEEIERQINEIMSKNQDLFAKAAVVWEGCLKFKLESEPLEWSIACHVAKVKTSDPVENKTLNDLADGGFKLNDEIDITPASSQEPSRAASLDNLSMAADEILNINREELSSTFMNLSADDDLKEILIDQELPELPPLPSMVEVPPRDEPKIEKKVEEEDNSSTRRSNSYSASSIYMSMYSY